MNNDYDKFKEYLLLKKYSPATINSIIKAVEYFKLWATSEQIAELSEISYSDVMSFMQWCSKQGATQKTIAGYLNHIRKFYSYLISEKEIRENPVAPIKVQGIKRKIYYDILTREELQKLYQSYPVTIEHEAGKIIPPQTKNILSRKRNKVIVSLLVHQGLRVEEIAALRIQDLQLREGKITIHSQRRTAARIMRLESHQVYELMDYLHETRKAFLEPQETHSDKLFLQWKGGEHFYGITQGILKQLRKINHRVKNFDQVRASVITAWLKEYDLRKVQYLAGHKYVSSTEEYKVILTDNSQEDIAKYHPL
jgi:integrase/recombinase XerD